MLLKQEKRLMRHKRIRAKMFGTSKIPRLCVFRSNKHIYAQLIDDEKGQTLIAASDLEFKEKKEKHNLEAENLKTIKNKKVFTSKVALAFKVGKLIAKKALDKNIKKVVFDRGGYKYHGRVKAIAEGAREGGLNF